MNTENDYSSLIQSFTSAFSNFDYRSYLGEEERTRKQKEEQERQKREQQEAAEREKRSLKGRLKSAFDTSKLYDKEAAKSRREGAWNFLVGMKDEIIKPGTEISKSQKIISKGMEERKSRGDAAAFQRMTAGAPTQTNQEVIKNLLSLPEQVNIARQESPDTPVDREQEEVAKEIQQDKQTFNKNYIQDLNKARESGNVEAERKLTKQFEFINGIGGDDTGFEISDEELREAIINAQKWGAIALVELATVAIPGLKPLRMAGTAVKVARAGKAAKDVTTATKVAQAATKTGQWINKNKSVLGLEAIGGAISGGARAEAEGENVLQGALLGSSLAPVAVSGFGLAGQGLSKLWKKAGTSVGEAVAERQAQKLSQEAFNREVSEGVAARMSVSKMAKDINNGIAVEMPPEVLKVFNNEVTDFMGRDFVNDAAARIRGIEEIIDKPAARIRMPKLTELVKEMGDLPTPNYRELMKSKFSMILNDSELDAFKNTGILPKGTGLLPPNAKPDYEQLSRAGKKHLVVLDGIDVEDARSLVPRLKKDASGINVEDFRTNWVDEAAQMARDEANLAASVGRVSAVPDADDLAYKSLRDVNTELENVTKRLEAASDPVEVNQLARRQEELENAIYRKADEQAKAVQTYEGKMAEYKGAQQQRNMISNIISEKSIGQIKSAYSREIPFEKVKIKGRGLDEIASEYSSHFGTKEMEMDAEDFYELVGKLPTKKQIQGMKPTRADLEMTKDTFAPKRPEVKVSSKTAKQRLVKERDYTTPEGEKGTTYFIDGDPVKGNVMVEKSKNGYIMRNILLSKDERGKGLGSAIYKNLNEESIKNTGKPLKSIVPTRQLDSGEVLTELSDEARGLWDSLVKKGLAEKRIDGGYVFKRAETLKETPSTMGRGILEDTNKVTKKQVDKVKPVGEGEVKTSKLATRVEKQAVQRDLANAIEDLPEYRKMNVENQTEQATKLINDDYDQAVKVALGEARPTGDLLPESVYIAVTNKALRENDAELLRRLSTQSSIPTEATAMGQRIRMLAELDDYSPVSAMQEVSKRKRSIAGKNIDEVVKKETKQLVKKIDEASMKPKDLDDFIKGIRC